MNIDEQGEKDGTMLREAPKRLRELAQDLTQHGADEYEQCERARDYMLELAVSLERITQRVKEVSELMGVK